MTSPLEHKHLAFFDYVNDPSWRVFRIMAEFVQGMTFLSRLEQTVTFFGSARLKPEHPYYELARQIGQRVAKHGYTVVTGGGPGVMEAGNRGAADAGGKSIGLNIVLPHEQALNHFVTPEYFREQITACGAFAEIYFRAAVNPQLLQPGKRITICKLLANPAAQLCFHVRRA